MEAGSARRHHVFSAALGPGEVIEDVLERCDLDPAGDDTETGQV